MWVRIAILRGSQKQLASKQTTSKMTSNDREDVTEVTTNDKVVEEVLTRNYRAVGESL